MTDDSTNATPGWWSRNATLRDELGIPGYEPPRFEDDTYAYVVVSDLESRLGCDIRFRSDVNPAYPDDWRVAIDGDDVIRVGRHRDENGNTVYELTADAFRERIVRAAREDLEPSDHDRE